MPGNLGRGLETVLQDLRYAVRQIIQKPAVACLVVLALALGIGANMAVFSLVNMAVLRPLPGTRDDGRLVTVWFPNDRGNSFIPYPDYRAFAEAATTFSALGTEIRGPTVRLRANGVAPRVLPIDVVTDNYFALLEVPLHIGRGFTPADGANDAPPVAVLSYRLWSDAFRADSTLLGRTIRLEDADVTVIGVANARFRGSDRIAVTDAWLPFSTLATVIKPFGPSAASADYLDHPKTAVNVPELFGRLADGVSIEQVEAQLRQIETRLASDATPKAIVGRGMGMWMGSRAQVGATLRLLGGIAGAFILVALANVTNLLLFRGVRRRDEAAIRRAIGAGSGRLLQQDLIEGLLLATVAAAGAAALAAGIVRLFRGVQLPGLLALEDVSLDWRVFAFGMGLAAIIAPALAMLPTLLSGGARLSVSLKESVTRGATRQALVRGSLTVIQLVASLVLLVGTLLLTRTVRQLRAVDLGFDPRGLGVFSVDFATAGMERAAARPLVQLALNDIAALPAVTDVATVFEAPFTGYNGTAVARDHEPSPRGDLIVTTAWVSPDYFSVARSGLRAGRTFQPVTVPGGGVSEAIVTVSLARSLFGDEDPLDRTFRTADGPKNVQYRVVGVAPDTRWRSINRPGGTPVLFRTMADPSAPASPNVAIMLRSTGSFARLRSVVEPLLRARAGEAPVTAHSMDDLVDATISEPRLFARISTLLSALALMLSAIGVYGVVAFSVAERTREIGIRMALGARRAVIARLVGRQGVVLAAVAIPAGIAAGAGLSRLLTARLFGVTPLDPGVYASATMLIACVLTLANLIPVLSATRVDPAISLKAE